jgi:tripartite-type tricarboxylate transporter receptor subunit TctC
MPPGGRKQRGGLALALLFFGWAQAPAAADSSAHSFPDRPVKVIVQTAAGASIDVAARIIADALSRRWRQQAMVLNQPGAGGAVAAKALIAAPADGHTLLLAASSIFVVLPELQRAQADDIRALIPIAFIGEQPMAIAVSGHSPARALAELIAHIRSTPGG